MTHTLWFAMRGTVPCLFHSCKTDGHRIVKYVNESLKMEASMTEH